MVSIELHNWTEEFYGSHWTEYQYVSKNDKLCIREVTEGHENSVKIKVSK